jgi:hypothetical protein
MNENKIEDTTRKEIYDYLRNVQKATEIKARLSGINIWVLYGGIALIGWALLDPKSPDVSFQIWQLVLFFCQIIVCLLNIQAVSNKSPKERDLRLLPNWMASRTNLSPHWCARYIWYAIPFLISGVITGFKLHSIVIPALMFLSIISELFIQTENDDLSFLSIRPEKIKSFIMCFFLVVLGSIVWSNLQLLNDPKNFPNRDEVKVIASLVSIYYLIFLLIRRGLTDITDAWTYDLEKRMLLGICSTADALTEIENHSLGARLLNVVDSKRQAATSAIEKVRDHFVNLTRNLPALETISPNYIHERKAQFSKMADPVNEAILEFTETIIGVENFSKKLENKNKGIKDKRIEKLADDLKRDIVQFRAELRTHQDQLAAFEKKF